MPEDVRYFEVNAKDEVYYHHGSQFDTKDGYLYIFEYKEAQGYALPQLTSIACYTPDYWMSITEITKDLYDQAQEHA